MVGDNGWSGDPQGEASSLARLAALHGGCSCRRCPSSMGGGWCNGGAVGGEDAPVGEGPRRTRPHPGARTKYIAPVEVHGGGSACGFLETGGL